MILLNEKIAEKVKKVMFPLFKKKEHSQNLYDFLYEFPMLEGKNLFTYDQNNQDEQHNIVAASLNDLKNQADEENELN